MLFVQSVIPHDVVKNGTYSRKLIFLTIGGTELCCSEI